MHLFFTKYCTKQNKPGLTGAFGANTHTASGATWGGQLTGDKDSAPGPFTCLHSAGLHGGDEDLKPACCSGL